MKKRLTAMACALCLCAGLILPAAAAESVETTAEGYTDVPAGAWYETAVAEATANGYMTGVAEGLFAPEDSVTRATVVTVLWRMEGSPAPAASVSFGDVSPDAWYAQAVAWAKENGIANGDTRGDFKPDQAVNRQELAAFLTRYDQYRGVELAEGSLALYSDANMTGVWAVESMRHAVGMGWLEGNGDKLMPGGLATRAQLAVILQRLTTQAMG